VWQLGMPLSTRWLKRAMRSRPRRAAVAEERAERVGIEALAGYALDRKDHDESGTEGGIQWPRCFAG
jgi:hypothetical protein